MSSQGVHRHLPRLDSIRGLAALMVAASHTFAGIPTTFLSPFYAFLIDGRIAVSIFFVLSGLVLGMSLRRAGDLNPRVYGAFCIRRFFRIYPAYFVCTLPYLAALFILHFLAHHGFFIGFGVFNEHYRLDQMSLLLSKWELVGNFLFIHQGLNGVTWTLKVEAIAAIILPFLHYASYHTRWRGRLLLLGALFALSMLSNNNTRINLYLFYYGYLIPPLLDEFSKIKLVNQRFFFRLILLAVISVFMDSTVFREFDATRRFGVIFAGLGSLWLLMLMLAGSELDTELFPILDHAGLRFLGTISYSFYLLNYFCLDAAQRVISIVYPGELERMPALECAWIIFLVQNLLCVLLATLSHLLVERPLIKFGAHFYRS